MVAFNFVCDFNEINSYDNVYYFDFMLYKNKEREKCSRLAHTQIIKFI